LRFIASMAFHTLSCTLGWPVEGSGILGWFQFGLNHTAKSSSIYASASFHWLLATCLSLCRIFILHASLCLRQGVSHFQQQPLLYYF
jgi:hypothetical protein